MQSKAKLAILLLIVANIIWGAAFPIYKLILTQVPPFTFVFLRFFLGSLILFPFVYKSLRVKIKDILPLLLLSLSGITLTISFLNFGLKLASSINAPIIISSGPIFLIIGSFLFLKEKLNSKIILGTLVSFLGVLVIVLMPILDKGLNGSVNGNLFLVFATFFSVVHALLLKKIITNYNNPLTIVFWSFLIGSLPLLPFVSNEYSQIHWIFNLDFKIIMGILFSVILATAFAHSIFAYGIKYIKGSEIGIFSYVDPIAAILVAVPLLNEKITIPYLIGAFLVFTGIFFAEGRLNYHPLHKLFK